MSGTGSDRGGHSGGARREPPRRAIRSSAPGTRPIHSQACTRSAISTKETLRRIKHGRIRPMVEPSFWPSFWPRFWKRLLGRD